MKTEHNSNSSLLTNYQSPLASKLLSRVRSLIERGERLGVDDCCELFGVKDLAAIASLARVPRERRHGRSAWYRAVTPLAVATLDDLAHVRDSAAPDGVGIAVRPVGGCAATLDAVIALQAAMLLLPVPATLFLSAGIVARAAQASGIAIPDAIRALITAGPLFINGDEAELSDPAFRAAHSAAAIPFQQWLVVHRAAHAAGLRTGASMVYMVADRPAEYGAHLQAIRQLQDQTNGFVQFVPMGVQNKNVDQWYLAAPTAAQSLRTVAIARMFLDNIPHIAVAPSLVTSEESFVALSYGATMIDPSITLLDVVSDEGMGTPPQQQQPFGSQPSLPVFAPSTARQRGGILPRLIHSRIIEARWVPVPMDAAFNELPSATILAEQ